MNELEKQFPIEQLSLLLKQSYSAFAATIAVVSFIIFKVHDSVDTFWLTTWVSTVLIINIYLLIWIYLVHHKTISTISAKRFILAYQIEAILHGASWGMLPFLFAKQAAIDMQFFAYIVLCGMAAGAIGSTGMIYRIYLSFMLPMMLPAITIQLFFGDIVTLFGSNTIEVLLIFVVSLVILAHTHYDSIRNAIIFKIENKKLLADATKAFEKADAASQAKTRFLANMSHELRTPLNAVIGYSELIYENSEDKYFETMSQDALKITYAGKHLLSLINNVLDLSKIESGKMDVYIESTDANQLFTEIKETMEHIILKNNNHFIFEVPQNIGLIETDITKLRQILLNIIGNAAKFTSNGEVKIKVTTYPEKLGVIISDTGIGMTKKQLKDLSTPFMQADISTTKKYGGTGLGMSLTEHLTKLIHIKLHVQSSPDKGTSFELEIPLIYNEANNTGIKKGADITGSLL